MSGFPSVTLLPCALCMKGKGQPRVPLVMHVNRQAIPLRHSATVDRLPSKPTVPPQEVALLVGNGRVRVVVVDWHQA